MNISKSQRAFAELVKERGQPAEVARLLTKRGKRRSPSVIFHRGQVSDYGAGRRVPSEGKRLVIAAEFPQCAVDGWGA